MLIAGVDLAAEPKGTALAIIDWSLDAAVLVELQLGVDDEEILAKVESFEKLGIDCALGWPIEFVKFVNQNMQAADGSGSGIFDGGIESRRRLAYRETDRQVREVTGRWPLSVSTDRLAMTAIRCAGLLSKIQAAGTSIDRAGTGKVVEIYPGASLRLWGFDTAGYRNSPEIRAMLVADIQAEAPWLHLGKFDALMIDSCDAFDAVIAALAARAAQLGKYHAPAPSQLRQAQVEGWVALPNSPLASLFSHSTS
jgi:predicted nuclease with RNAse H fold